METLASGAATDDLFLAQFIATGKGGATSTPWSGISHLPAAGTLQWHDGRIEVHHADPWRRSAITTTASDDEAVVESRRLMVEAVRSELDQDGTVWADLSGGHDSSAVAAIGGWLNRQGDRARLGGSVTFVDSIGDGDETRFADHVTREYGLPSIRIVDPAPWADDGQLPPSTDAPARDYPFWLRDKCLSAQLAEQGSTRLLSGIGPDFYLPLTPAYAVDLLSEGKIAECFEVVREWTLQTRGKLWRVAGQELLLPLAPRWLQAEVLRGKETRPRWLRPEFARRTQFDYLQPLRNVVRAWPGSVCAERVAQRLSEAGASLPHWRTCPGIEIRHPLLYLPLIGFCLALPRRLRSSFAHPKPILRFAMRGIVPEAILQRHTKGSLILPRVCWAFRVYRDKLVRLLQNSILADLGVIEPAQLLADIDACALGANRSARQIYFALSLETWLTVRNHGGHALIR